MKDPRQIKVISSSLAKEKDRCLNELGILNKSIDSKQAMIAKMRHYQHDYLSNHDVAFGQGIPLFYKNNQLFLKKISHVIRQAELEINNLAQLKNALLKHIAQIDKKIELMNIFNNKNQLTIARRERRREQRSLDDIAATTKIRSEHE